MSSKQKEHEKSLKQPDQFQVQVMSWMDKLLKRWKEAVAVAALALIAAGGVFGYQKFKVSQRDSRIVDLGKAQVVYDEEMRKAGEAREAIQKEIEALNAKITPPPPAPPKGEGEAAAAVDAPILPATPDPALVAQRTELEKKAEAIKADHSGSLKLYQEVFGKHAKAAEGWNAGMTAARILIDQDKVNEASPLLEKVLVESKENPFYQTQARLAFVGVLEEQGNYDRALTEIDALEKAVGDDLKPKVLLTRGRIQLLKDQKTEAKATFDSLIEKHAASPEAQKARSIQALFN